MAPSFYPARQSDLAATQPLPLAAALPTSVTAPSARRHAVRSRPGRIGRQLSAHWRRFALFGSIGGFVFVAGLALQIALVRYVHMGADSSYAGQTLFSIELSYVLNRYLTWRDRDVGFWLACWKFTVQKAGM